MRRVKSSRFHFSFHIYLAFNELTYKRILNFPILMHTKIRINWKLFVSCGSKLDTFPHVFWFVVLEISFNSSCFALTRYFGRLSRKFVIHLVNKWKLSSIHWWIWWGYCSTLRKSWFLSRILKISLILSNELYL